MNSITADMPSPSDFDDGIDIAREHLRLGVAYHLAHYRLAQADVVVRAAVAFTTADDAEASEVALENLFDAVKVFRAAREDDERPAATN